MLILLLSIVASYWWSSKLPTMIQTEPNGNAVSTLKRLSSLVSQTFFYTSSLHRTRVQFVVSDDMIVLILGIDSGKCWAWWTVSVQPTARHPLFATGSIHADDSCPFFSSSYGRGCLLGVPATGLVYGLRCVPCHPIKILSYNQQSNLPVIELFSVPHITIQGQVVHCSSNQPVVSCGLT